MKIVNFSDTEIKLSNYFSVARSFLYPFQSNKNILHLDIYPVYMKFKH